MTRELTLKKICANAILLEMCIPYAESAGEDKRIIEILDSISQFTYEFLHVTNTASQTSAIEEAAELYLNYYREVLSEEINSKEAKDLLTICISCIYRNISEFEPMAERYYKEIKNALKLRARQYKLPKEKSDFAKWLRLSLMKSTNKISL